MNVQRTPAVPASKRALAWEDYDWEAGLSNEEEATVYKAFLELQPIAKVDLFGLKELYEAGCHVVTPIEESKGQMNTLEQEENNKMVKGRPRKSREAAGNPRPLKITKKEEADMEERPIYPAQFYKVKEGEIVIDRISALEPVKGKQIAGWTIEDDEMIKEINLGTKEEPKMVRVGKDIEEKYEKKLIEVLKSYKDAFAWTYEDMKGIPPHICEHKIEIEPDANLVKQSRYRMNPTYAAQVKEEIDKLVKTGFVYPVDRSKWLSPIVIVPKTNGKLRVCVDYCKLNAVTKSDPFPLPFTESILETVAGHDIYSLLDGFCRNPC